jgi:FkbM family methyltransferase
MYNFIRSIRYNFIIAKRSGYATWKEKWLIFKTLNSLQINSTTVDSSGYVKRKIFGYDVYAFDVKTLRYLFLEIFVEREYLFDSANPKPFIIDCGANIGMAILYFKMLYPKASVLAFEPNPSVFELLKKNIEANNLQDVVLVNTALSSLEGTTEFYFGDSMGTLSGSLMQERGGGTKIQIKTEKLSKYLSNKKPDLIKIDVEGAEFEILKDLIDTKTIQQASNYLVEYHHKINDQKSKFSEFLNPFETNGFEYNIRTNFHQKGHFQDAFIWFYKEN